MCYARMIARYKGRLDPEDEKYASNLFKRIFSNHLSDISTRDQRSPQELVDIDSPQGAVVTSSADVMLAVAEAPEPIKSVLRLILDKPEIVLGTPMRLRLNGKRDRLGKRIRSMLPNVPGIDDNIMSRLKTYLEKGYDPATHNHEKDRVRCCAQDTRAQVKVPEYPRAQVRPGSNDLRSAVRVWQSKGDGGRLRIPQDNHDGRDWRTVGPRSPGMGSRHGRHRRKLLHQEQQDGLPPERADG